MTRLLAMLLLVACLGCLDDMPTEARHDCPDSLKVDTLYNCTVG